MTSIPTEAQARPTLAQALTNLVAPHVPESSQLFRQEVDRAVERQGGRDVLEDRLDQAADERRADRAGGFESYRSSVRDARESDRDRGRPRDEETGEALVDRSTTSEPERVAKRSDRSGRTEAERPTEERRPRSDASGRRADAANEPTAAREPAATAAVQQGSQGANGVTAGEGAKLAVNGARAAAAATARPAEGTQAFLQGARPESAVTAKTPGAAAPATPNAELIEHAAEVLQQIRFSLSRGAKEISVQLAPQDLGRLSIKLRVDDGRLSAVVRAENAQTLELLERQAPELRAILAQQGFDAENIELELGSTGDAGARAGEGGPGSEAGSDAPGSHATYGLEEEQTTESPTELRVSDGLVDTYA